MKGSSTGPADTSSGQHMPLGVITMRCDSNGRQWAGAILWPCHAMSGIAGPANMFQSGLSCISDCNLWVGPAVPLLDLLLLFRGLLMLKGCWCWAWCDCSAELNMTFLVYHAQPTGTGVTCHWGAGASACSQATGDTSAQLVRLWPEHAAVVGRQAGAFAPLLFSFTADCCCYGMQCLMQNTPHTAVPSKSRGCCTCCHIVPAGLMSHLLSCRTLLSVYGMAGGTNGQLVSWWYDLKVASVRGW
jgi:hypothetical protein